MSDSNTLIITTELTVTGDTTETLTPAALESLPVETLEARINCASGNGYSASWEGIPLLEILDHTAAPETTHVLLTSADDYRVCIDIETASTGLLAFARDGDAFAANDDVDYDSRFVAVELDGARTTKDVAVIEAVTLAPDERPEEYEQRSLEE